MRIQRVMPYAVLWVLLLVVLLGLGGTFSTPKASILQATTKAWVDDDDPTCGGNSPCFKTIQAAVDALPEGKVYIRPGLYREHVMLTKNVELIGAGRELVAMCPVYNVERAVKLGVTVLDPILIRLLYSLQRRISTEPLRYNLASLIITLTLLVLGGKIMLLEAREWHVPRDFTTIQAAIDAAGESDVILIDPGLYREQLVIGKSLTLRATGPQVALEGEPSEFEPIEEESITSLQGGPFSQVVGIYWSSSVKPKIGQPVITVKAGQVRIQGLQIHPQGLQSDSGPSERPLAMLYPLRAGIVVERGAEALIEQVIIRHAHYGIVVKRGASLTLRHSILHNWHRGLQIWGTATVEDSFIHNEDIYAPESSEIAVFVEGGQVFLRRNQIAIFHADPYGMPAHRLGDFFDIAIEASDSELVVEDNHIVGDLHRNIIIDKGKASIRNNLLIYRGGNEFSIGLDIRSTEAFVEGNIVIGMMPYGVGIRIMPEAQVVLKRNRLSQNEIGIKISGAVARLIENEIYANRTGIQLAHSNKDEIAHVEMVRNQVRHNEECGIAAHQYIERQKVYEIFKGQLEGEENEIEGNLGSDLCPLDYPWPPGFRK